MCYKTALDKKADELAMKTGRSFRFPQAYTSYKQNDAFTATHLYIIPQDDTQKIYPAAWGLVPDFINTSNSKLTPRDFVNRYKTYNARGEEFFEKRTYAASAAHKRCLILADGFYEPHHYNGKSQPFLCYLPGKSLFVFAGLFTKLDNDRYTTTIVTVQANETFEWVHNQKKRMPLVLDETLQNEWISDLNKNQVNEIVTSGFTGLEFQYHPVTNDIYKNRTMNGKKAQEKVDAFDPQYYQRRLF